MQRGLYTEECGRLRLVDNRYKQGDADQEENLNNK
jgi:hypothetical protein